MLTPNWNWHDHNHHGDEPMVWFDGLDLPLVATLESIFFENHPDRAFRLFRRDELPEQQGVTNTFEPR